MRIKNLTSNDKVPYLYLITVFSLTFLGIIYWPGIGFSARYLGWALGIILPAVLAPKFFNQRSFAFFIAYAIVVYLNYMAKDSYFSNMKKVMEGLVTLYIPLGITYYAMRYRNKDWMRAIFLVAMFVVIWITIATAFVDVKIPGAVRIIHTELQNGDAELSDYKHFYAMGLSNYLLPHALPAIIPIFAIGLREKGFPIKRKIVPIALLLCIMMLIYFSGATGPMMVGIGTLAFSLWVKPGRIKAALTSAIIFALLVLPFLFSDDLMLNLLKTIDDLMGNEGHFHGKVVAFQESILLGEASGTLANRQDLYWADIEAFLDNIIIGTQAQGGHSVILARLGSLGLVGIIPFIMILIDQAKMSVKIIPLNYRIYYYLGSLAAFLMILTKGVASWEVYFFWFTLLPFGIVFFADRNERIRSGKYIIKS